MKVIYKSIFFSVALMLGMISCDKDEIPPTGPQDNAEELVKGTYVGEWTRITVAGNKDGSDIIEVGPGSITFSVDKEKYSNNVSVMTFDVTGVDIGIKDPKTTVCNISLFSSGVFSFWNLSTTNPFGVVFYGKIDTQGEVSMTYTNTVPAGKGKEITYNYSFIGSKM